MMCILIDPIGNVNAELFNINKLINPVEVGRFVLSSEANRFLRHKVNTENIKDVFQFIPSDIKKYCDEKKLIQTKASIFKKSTNESDQGRSSASEIPHINEGNEIHFIFAGSYVFYFNIDGRHYSTIVQEGDWVFIPARVEHWIKPTKDNFLIIASFHSEPFEVFHTKVTYTNTKTNAFI